MMHYKAFTLVSIIIFLSSCATKSPYMFYGQNTNPQTFANKGYLAGSIGTVMGSDLSPLQARNYITIRKQDEIKTFLILRNISEGSSNTPADFKKRSFKVSTFNIPLEKGVYIISGIHYYNITDPLGLFTIKNRSPISVPITIKENETTYIGQYLAHTRGTFFVRNEVDRDSQLLANRTKLVNLKPNIPNFDTAANHFKFNDDPNYYHMLDERMKIQMEKYKKRRRRAPGS